METEQGKQDNSGEMETRIDKDEAARAAKKLKASYTGTSTGAKKKATGEEFPAVITTELGTVVMPEFDNIMNMRATKFSDMSQEDQDRVMAHQLQDKENKKLLEKKGFSLGDEEEEQHEVEKEKVDADEEMEEEELVDYGDSQEKKTDQDREEDVEYPTSQDFFTTKVNKLTSGSLNKNAKLIKVKLEKEKSKQPVLTEEPRRCPRLKNQEDADRTDLAMKRAAQKNEITGNDILIPTVINCNDRS
jgi:hypothetical protein